MPFVIEPYVTSWVPLSVPTQCLSVTQHKRLHLLGEVSMY